MLNIITSLMLRIISNSYLNVFQKILTSKGQRPTNINFLTYFGLFVICILFFNHFTIDFNNMILLNTLVMGLLGALGNYYIIKALSVGELSSLAPLNSYKPIVAGIIGYFYLNEIPTLTSIIGIILIIAGTYMIYNNAIRTSYKAIFYRILALIFSGAEAVFIKKIIIMTSVPTSFCLWVFAGMIFSGIFVLLGRNRIKIVSYKNQLLLILSVGIMQLSTNYIFAHINVSYALALFQLSTILSVFLGVNIFKESNLRLKLTASTIMIIGAVIIILS